MNLSDSAATEFLADASRRSAYDPHIAYDAPVSAFLNWVLTPNRFSQVVIPTGNRSWLQRLLHRPEGFPQVARDLGVVVDRRQDLQRLACAGFGLLIGSNETPEVVADYLRGLGYTEAGTSALDEEGLHSPLKAAWNPRSLKSAVQLAFALPCRSVCVFGHDGDPAYLLFSVRNASGTAARSARIAE